MRIAVTGATGFLGRYLVAELQRNEHQLRCWYRGSSNRSKLGSPDRPIEWVEGQLPDEESATRLVQGCDALVHAALWRPHAAFQGQEGDVVEFATINMIGTLRLFEAAKRAGVGRTVFVSSCAVHDKILDDRTLDETHPLWPASHYGAHKAAIEAFIHSYGLGHGDPICAVRPTGIYGVAEPLEQSKWFPLVQAVVQGQEVDCQRGGKEVHAADVAKAVQRLLEADDVTGQSYNCYDRYVSEFEVASLAREIAQSSSQIHGQSKSPKHQIDTQKIRALGMQFGGTDLLRETIADMISRMSRKSTGDRT